jgi:uncharacterized protein
MWSRGDVVALRDLWFGAVWRAVAGIVVEETEQRSVFWIPAGSESVYPADGDGHEIRIPRRTFTHAVRLTRRPIVVVCDDGTPWTLWLFFEDVGVFGHWYVNFEQYLGRSAVAYDSVDHKLDLIVRADGDLTWKDEDELEQAGALGLVDVDAVRRDAAAAVASPPWPTGWEDFTPDPSWAVPELPAGWDQV